MLRKLLSMVFVLFFAITFTSSASAAMGDNDSMPTTNMPQMMQDDFTVKISMTPELGPFLVDSQGRTLYYFMKDMPMVSNCKGKCSEVWPPFYAEKVIVPKMLNPQDFGMITREDGMMQTTYKNWPLYYFSKDETANDIKGQGFNNLWFVIKVSQ